MAAMSPHQVFRDASGRSLADYPRPSIAVDTAVLTLLPDDEGRPLEIGVLLVRRPTSDATARLAWALPGTFLHEGETLARAVRRSLEAKAAVTGRAPQQLRVFDDPARDNRGWVLSVAHLDVMAPADLESLRDVDATRVVPVQSPGRLPYDHSAIIELAVERIRGEYEERPDPRHLLPRRFTIADLRAVHEAVAGRPLQKDTFRRAMLDKLVEASGVASGRVGRPAQLYSRRNGT
jgi:ADP-ribose pyrophosphatase YjhB (NUDIX family)